MIINVNGNDITSRLLGFKTSNEMNSDSLLMGNAVCKKLELKLDNQDGELTSLIDYPFFVYYSIDKALGVFFVYEKPEKYTGLITLTLYDKMYSFNQVYDTKLDYQNTVTIKNQLDEMQSITGVAIDYSTLSSATLNKTVMWYDNTVSMRNYLGWIAELDGCNVFATENGNITFRNLATEFYNTVDVEDYQRGELVTVTRICFDDGVIKQEVGDTSGNTLYISSNNAYVDSNTDLQPILDKYQYLTFFSVKDVKMANIENWYLTDLVLYNNEFLFMPLSINEEYKGGHYSIATVSGEVNTINNEIVVNRPGDPSKKIRRLQTMIDKNDLVLKIVAEQTDKNTQKITDMEITIDGFEMATSKIEELETKVGLTYWIESSVGYMLDESVEEIATLTAHIYIEDVEQDVDGELYYNWYKVDYEGNEIHLGQGKTIEVYTSLLGGCNVFFTADTENGETFYFVDEHGNVLTDENGNVFTYQ